MEDLKREMTIEELEEKYKAIAQEKDNLATLLDQKKKEAEEIRQTQLASERKNRIKEIEAAGKHYRDLISQFIKDYNSYSFIVDAEDVDWSFLFGSKPWRMFF